MGANSRVAAAMSAVLLLAACSLSAGTPSEPTASAPPPESGAMVGFGYKATWLAFKDLSQADVAAALGIDDAIATSWEEAIDAAYDADNPAIAITPPLSGATGTWVLAVGVPLEDPEPDVAALSRSTKTDVQYFASARVVDVISWNRASVGQLTRGFFWIGESGEITTWIGPPTDVELSLGLPDVRVATDSTIDAILDSGIDEESVLTVAEAWSVNPSAIDGQESVGTPLVGHPR